MTRARDLSRLANSNAFSVNASNRIGIGSTVPRADLDVVGNVLIGDDISIQSGIVTANTFSGNITGVAATFTGNVLIGDDISIQSGIVTATTFSGNITGVAATFTGDGGISDNKGNVRDIPQNSQTSSYILTATDAGKHVSITTGGVTVPASVLEVGSVVTIYNNSGSNQTITQGTSVTLRLAGSSNTGNRTLGQYGLCSVVCVASNVFVISGVGLS